jgi:[acyl-carrier-protein] S-malonyltransferase
MSEPTAFLFPGQGSQAVGMGKSLYDNEPAARARFEEADAILGRPLSQLCFDGPEDELKKTANTQPALFVCSVAAADVLRERGVEPNLVAGHSLGEYSALCSARVFDFATGLRLVETRGHAMAEAGQATPGAMAAVIGLDIEQVDNVCHRAATPESIVVVANDNSPGQTVISGSVEGVERACALAREAGAKRALPLPVSGGFHSPLVAHAREVMARCIAEVEFRAPSCAYISQVTGQVENCPITIRRHLVEQVTSRVRWVESVHVMKEQGITRAFEVGPGKVLAGLVKRIERTIAVQPAGTSEDISSCRP